MSDKTSQVLLIGHRGANMLAPENTLKSFQKAIDLKADYLEFDVHLSRDGELVIIHDSNTRRTTGYKGIIAEMTLKEIEELDAGEGEKIPTLDELIDLAKGKIGLQLEIKAAGIARMVVNKLRDVNLIDSTIVSSFNHGELIEIKKIEPNLRVAALLLGLRKKKVLSKCINENFQYIHPYYKFINKKFIERAHNNEIKVNAWTLNKRINMEKMIEKGIDGIITNDIELAKDVLNRKD